MPLSNTVYLGGQAPDHTAAGISIAKTRPDPYGAFQQGYDDQQKRQAQDIANKTALQNYRQAVIKADLANAMYPDLLKAQQAAIAGTGQQYGVSPSAVTPVRTGSSAAPTAAPSTPAISPAAAELARQTPYTYQPSGGGVQLQQTPPPQLPGAPNTSLGDTNFPPIQGGGPLSSADFNAPVYAPPVEAVAPAVAEAAPAVASASPLSFMDFGGGAGDAASGMEFGDMAGMFG